MFKIMFALLSGIYLMETFSSNERDNAEVYNTCNNFIVLTDSNTQTIDTLVLEGIDTLIGYWYSDDFKIYFLDIDFYQRGCKNAVELFDLQAIVGNSEEIEADCYNFEFYGLIPSTTYTTLVALDTLDGIIHYTFKHTLVSTGPTPYIDSVDVIKSGSYKTRTFLVTSTSEIRLMASDEQKCLNCYFHYSPKEIYWPEK